MNFEPALSSQLLRRDESVESYMNPTHPDCLARISSEKSVHLFQNRLHYALASYLNGASTVDTDSLERVGERVDFDTPDLDPEKTLLRGYEWVAENVEPGDRVETVRLEDFNSEDYQRNDLEREIRTIADRLDQVENDLITAILHGSFGDRTYVRDYSDVDLLLIVSVDCLQDKSRVSDLRAAIRDVKQSMYFIDPHQHHGVMVVSDVDLKAYNRAYLPPAAITEGTVLQGKTEITFSTRDDRLERRHSLWRNVQRLRRAVTEEKFPVGFDGEGHLQPDYTGHLYSFKYFTSFVMIQPSMYFLAAGDPMYKSKSFDSLPHLDSGNSILEACTTIRRKYPEHVEFNRSDRYRKSLANDSLDARARQQSAIPLEFQEILDGNPFVQALEFTEQLWTRV
jgi:hypothetical protein